MNEDYIVNQYSSKTPENTKYRIWWIPQIPMSPFFYQVETLVEGKILLDALAQYDHFQFDNNIKPDYSNVGGLQEWDSDMGWTDWYHPEDGEDIDYYSLNELKEMENRNAKTNQKS